MVNRLVAGGIQMPVLESMGVGVTGSIVSKAPSIGASAASNVFSNATMFSGVPSMVYNMGTVVKGLEGLNKVGKRKKKRK